MAEYQQHGIRFQYPDDWELADGHDGEARTITVSSAETSFWCVSLFDETQSMESVVQAALAAFEEEYDDVDAYPAESKDASTELSDYTIAWDVEFLCLELTNTARIRATEAGGRTVLVLYQGTDHELEQTLPALQEITDSLILS